MADYNCPQRGLNLIENYLPRYQALQHRFSDLHVQHKQRLQYYLCTAILLCMCSSITSSAKTNLSRECEAWYGMQLRCFRRLENEIKTLLYAIEEDLVDAYRYEKQETGQDAYESTRSLRMFRNDVRDLLDRLKAARPDAGRRLDTRRSREGWSSHMGASTHDSTASSNSRPYPPSPAQGHGIPLSPDRCSYDSDSDSDQLYESDSDSFASTLEESQSVWDRNSPEVPPEAPLPPAFDRDPWRCRWR